MSGEKGIQETDGNRGKEEGKHENAKRGTGVKLYLLLFIEYHPGQEVKADIFFEVHPSLGLCL